jgi:hypothetical protein
LDLCTFVSCFSSNYILLLIGYLGFLILFSVFRTIKIVGFIFLRIYKDPKNDQSQLKIKIQARNNKMTKQKSTVQELEFFRVFSPTSSDGAGSCNETSVVLFFHLGGRVLRTFAPPSLKKNTTSVSLAGSCPVLGADLGGRERASLF